MILNKNNPYNENIEKVIIHAPHVFEIVSFDQLTESLIDNTDNKDANEYTLVYERFMLMLEQTVEACRACRMSAFGENNEWSYGLNAL